MRSDSEYIMSFLRTGTGLTCLHQSLFSLLDVTRDPCPVFSGRAFPVNTKQVYSICTMLGISFAALSLIAYSPDDNIFRLWHSLLSDVAI